MKAQASALCRAKPAKAVHHAVCGAHLLQRRPAPRPQRFSLRSVASQLPDLSNVTLPTAQELADERSHGMRTKPRVLFIDGDGSFAQVLSALLTPEATVVHVASLREARLLLARDIFSLAVLDPALPDGDGAQLLPALATTPLLLYAHHNPAWRTSALAFLPKPFTPHRHLWLAIARMLGVESNYVAGD